MTIATHQPNFRSPAALMAEAQNVWRRLFEHSPLPILVLAPDLRIIDANESYLREVSRSRETLAGLDMLEAFPDNPLCAGADGVRNLSASFETVLHTGRGHVMPPQRYDIQPDARPWQVRYWYPKDWSVLDDKGSTVALVHHVADATASILHREKLPLPSSSRSSENVLQRADEAIWEARELVRQTHESILACRAGMKAGS
ncbi:MULTISPECIES: PAS domain-containing protein [Bradyrhizobium]|uniref:PAS domain-containing protein n=1 Tax=Bradyrhizobium elkanii TaxID=29448 RepID=UPI000687FD46|nr:PAS domain-containing protein [Bradyrhizobium elkanii]